MENWSENTMSNKDIGSQYKTRQSVEIKQAPIRRQSLENLQPYA